MVALKSVREGRENMANARQVEKLARGMRGNNERVVAMRPRCPYGVMPMLVAAAAVVMVVLKYEDFPYSGYNDERALGVGKFYNVLALKKIIYIKNLNLAIKLFPCIYLYVGKKYIPGE